MIRPYSDSESRSKPKRSRKRDEEASLEIGYRIEYPLDKQGQADVKYVPLTAEQALHPHEDDEFVASKSHSLAIQRLCEIADLRFEADPTYLSLTDTNVQFGEGFDDLRPDLIILLGVIRQQDPSLATFDYAEEAEPPRCPLVVEVTSPKTRDNDLVKKIGLYHQAGVEQYVIVDLPDPNVKNQREPRVLNYLLATHGRRRRPDRRDRRVLLECLRVWTSFEGQDLIFTDAQTGRTLWKYSEAVREAEAQKARADKAEADIQDEKIRADNEKARADGEKARADDEKARADQFAERIRQLEDQIRNSRNAADSSLGVNGSSPKGI